LRKPLLMAEAITLRGPALARRPPLRDARRGRAVLPGRVPLDRFDGALHSGIRLRHSAPRSHECGRP